MHTYHIIKSFTGALGNFVAGTTAEFEDGPAAILKEKGYAALEGSDAHKTFLASQTPATEEQSDTLEEKQAPAPELETKPASAPELETKPSPKKARK